MNKTLLDSFEERWKDRIVMLGDKGPMYKNPGQERALPMTYIEFMEWGSLILDGRIKVDNQG